MTSGDKNLIAGSVVFVLVAAIWIWAMTLHIRAAQPVDHRRVLRVCASGDMVIRNRDHLEVVRRNRQSGWDVAPGSTLENLCALSSPVAS